MPRKYEAVIGKSRRRQYPAAAMCSAIQALAEGRTVREVALQFNIPRSTLSDAYRGRHPRTSGGQTIFTEEEEEVLAHNIATLGDWGYPITTLEVHMLVRDYLQARKRIVPRFRANVPGTDWVRDFLKRQRRIVIERMCQNISAKRGRLSPEIINNFFHHLEVSLEGVPPTNIINFDETNLVDDPGQRKCVFRRGCKYPERMINSTKTATSIMFAGTGSGVLLSPYVVYKSEHLHDRWVEGGPAHVRYNRSRSGWFDSTNFRDWFETVIIPYCRRLLGKKVVMGDNLASHFSPDVIAKCEAANIAFVCLPPNSTHLLQPLDVAVFAPVKKIWRILTDWKAGEGRHLGTLPKDLFPHLLGLLLDALKPTVAKNLRSGFRKCGFIPLDSSGVLHRVAHTPKERQSETNAVNAAVSGVVVEHLSQLQHGSAAGVRQRKKRLQVVPGKIVSLADLRVSCGNNEVSKDHDIFTSEYGENNMESMDHDSDKSDDGETNAVPMD